MNGIVARYDRDAADYARYWAPVLERTSMRLLDYVEDFAGWVMRNTGRLRVLEVGAGTGTLLLEAARRWPAATFTATDAAPGMVGVARERASALASDRVTFASAPADDLPVDDGSVDLVLSTFVLQLVPDRLGALREAGRVLVPGGRVAYLTWLDRDAREPFLPAEEFDDAVYELAIEEAEGPEEPHAGDVPSGRAAAYELRRAGFVRASAREEVLAYDWSPDSYVEYKLRYDERALLSILSEDQRDRLERDVRSRLSRLSPADFRWHAPVVMAHGDKPVGAGQPEQSSA
jgi:ubiquinone/menaquinone biosynthesis C-methylase UbiE